MKVIVAHNRYRQGQPSGENIIVDAEINQLRAAGVEVVPLLRSSDEIATMSTVQKALLPVAPIYRGAAQRELRELLRVHRPDLLHLHNPYPLLSPWVIRTAHAARVPVVHTVHNYRQVCASGVYFRDGHPCTDCLGRRVGVPAVVHACYRGSRAQSAVMATTLALHRPTWHTVDRYLALTDEIAGHLREYGVAEERIVVKPNAIDDPWPGEPPPVGDGFLYLGRLVPEKGLPLLLEAWARHPVGSLGVLRIVGDGPLRTVAEAAARQRPDVRFLGRQPPDGVRAALRDSSVLVVPSLWRDVLPTVIIEALAAGRPVLGTDRGGIPYAIGAAGWTVPATVDALADALGPARAGAAGLAGAARARYTERFHPAVVTGQLIAVYRDVTGSPTAPW
ncbi:MAG: glycosyltransferase [Micromonosporaceae bacterium]